MVQKFNRVETLVRRAKRSRFAFLYSGYVLGRRAYRSVVNLVSDRQVGWVAMLQSGRWVGQSTFELTGWAYERGSGSNDVVPVVTIRCRNPRTRKRIEVPATMRYDSGANLRARLIPVDYGNFAFHATLDLGALLSAPSAEEWHVSVKVDSGDRVVTGTFRSRAKSATAGYLVARTVGDRQLLPRWNPKTGLSFRVRRPKALAEAVDFDKDLVTVTVRAPRFAVEHGALISENGALAMEVTDLGEGRYRLEASIPAPVSSATNDYPAAEPEEAGNAESTNPEDLGVSLPVLDHRLEITDAAGDKVVVASTLDERDTQPGSMRYAYSGLDSALTIRDTPAMLLVEQVELVAEPFSLHYTGRVLGDVTGASLVLTGPRQDLAVDLKVDGERFTAAAPLLISAWGRAPLPPQTGSYVLRGRTADGAWFRVGASSGLIHQTPILATGEWLKVRVGVTAGRRVSALLTAPLDDRLLGDYQQARLKAEYHARTFEPQEAIYFESFNGRIATCNPHALDREVARRFPELKRYWGVLDLSVAVPEGAIPVLKGTREWWEARSTCRYVIVNEWIRQKFKHQPFQVVLQTWHGSMFKRIGLDRPNFSKDEQLFLSLERGKWDILLSQNTHSTEIFRSAYSWDKPIWEEGYPRNDAMSASTGEPTRELLGIRPDQRAILYAPTWRDDHEEYMVDFLDLPAMAAELGDGYVILLRGHSRTLRAGGNVRVPGVIDVTSYPDVTELFLAADALITDYSSVMFDYSVTGRPIIFFVPDLAKYRDKTRGVYFDLVELAPGPVLFAQEDVVAAIRSAETDAPRYFDNYLAWRKKFNAHDDGHSAERVIDRLLALPKK